MTKKLIKPSVFRTKYFQDSSAPAVSTIRRWIDSGDLPGERIGNSYYIDENRLNMTGNPLVDSVLASS